MSKDALDKVAKGVKDTIDDATDAIHEGQHRSAADMERDKRATMGDVMTPGEKAGSALSEAKHRTEAAIDKTKREVRDRT